MNHPSDPFSSPFQAATREVAGAIGLSDIVGTLEPAKEADILVVEGDTTTDIKALHNVLAVFQRGQ